MHGLCPIGYYCEEGTIHPKPCPVGTYGTDPGYAAATECRVCPATYYCDEVGLTLQIIQSRNKICDAGYYCPGDDPAGTGIGATKPHPTDLNTEGGAICPAGAYCPSASSAFTQCPGGEYETREGSDACQECPEGYYCNGDPATSASCVLNDSSVCLGTQTPIECSSDDSLPGYCPAGSTLPTECPAGRFSNSTLVKMVSIDDCVFCPEGKYCTAGVVAGDCSAGYFCDFGASLAEDPGKICP